MVLFSTGCEKNNVDTEQNTTVEDSGNKDTSETIDSEKNDQKQEEQKMQYRGYTIQKVDYGFIIRDSAGLPLVEVETIAEAQKWIDIEKDGYRDFRELD